MNPGLALYDKSIPPSPTQVSVVEPKDEPLVQEPYSEPKEMKQMQPMGQAM